MGNQKEAFFSWTRGSRRPISIDYLRLKDDPDRVIIGLVIFYLMKQWSLTP
jgi:hypothetical protein